MHQPRKLILVVEKVRITKSNLCSMVNQVLRTIVHRLQDRMHSLLSPLERAKPSQHPLMVVNIVKIKKGIRLRVDSI